MPGMKRRTLLLLNLAIVCLLSFSAVYADLPPGPIVTPFAIPPSLPPAPALSAPPTVQLASADVLHTAPTAGQGRRWWLLGGIGSFAVVGVIVLVILALARGNAQGQPQVATTATTPPSSSTPTFTVTPSVRVAQSPTMASSPFRLRSPIPTATLNPEIWTTLQAAASATLSLSDAQQQAINAPNDLSAQLTLYAVAQRGGQNTVANQVQVKILALAKNNPDLLLALARESGRKTPIIAIRAYTSLVYNTTLNDSAVQAEGDQYLYNVATRVNTKGIITFFNDTANTTNSAVAWALLALLDQHNGQTDKGVAILNHGQAAASKAKISGTVSG